MKPSRSKIFLWSGLFLVFLVGVGIFQFNGLKTAESNFFGNFDRFSQALVAGNIIAHDEGVGHSVWNLGFATVNGNGERSDNIWNTWRGFTQSNSVESVSLSPYVSQYGVQGEFFLSLHKWFGSDITGLQLFNSIAFSLVITILAFLFTRAYNWCFGTVFFLVMVTSPWVVSFARNLYWIPFSWFLPAVFATMAYLSRTTLNRTLCLCGVGVAVFLKSLAGYEYLSNVTLFACSVFVIAPFFRERDRHHGFNFFLGCLAFVACLLGFACALLIHAGMRGDTITQGLITILEQDVKRRTYGDPSNFDPILRESLTVSFVDVIAMYWTKWATPVVTGVPAMGLNIASAFVLLGMFYSLVKKRTIDIQVLAVLVGYFLVSISWFVAAKAHSWVHTQLNYVLWYFGFIQALAYGVVSMTVLFGRDLLAWSRGLSRGAKRLMTVSVVVAVIILLGIGQGLRVNHFDKQIDARIAGAIGSVEIGNGFKVLFFNDHNAMLMSAACSDFNPSARVMLHAYPDVPQAPVSNLDFKWSKRDIPTPWFSKYREACMANLPRINFRIKFLEIGQYEVLEREQVKVLWQGRADIGATRYLREVSALDYTDGNWEKGINRTVPAFFVHNDFVNRQSLAIGDSLKVAASEQRTIARIGYSDDYINVYLDGALLDPEQNGFPNKLEVLAQ